MSLWFDMEMNIQTDSNKKDIADLQVGKAGEHLVCADLIVKGYVAFLSEQGLGYDVIVDIDGRLLRIQVKSAMTHRPLPQRMKHTPSYLFYIKRTGKYGRKTYRESDIDIFALVALDINKIAYISVKKSKTSMNFRCVPTKNNKKGKYFDNYSFELALQDLDIIIKFPPKTIKKDNQQKLEF